MKNPCAIVIGMAFLYCLEAAPMNGIDQTVIQKTINGLAAIYGDSARPRIERGVNQAARYWRPRDGSSDDFQSLCEKQFIADPDVLRMTGDRFEENIESLFGHLEDTNIELSMPVQVDIGPILPVDNLFAEYAPGAHTVEDCFRTGIAFASLLNFPLRTMEEKQALDAGSRREWMELRLAEKFAQRIPADIQQERAKAYVRSDDYISRYNIDLGHVLTGERRLFPNELKLISHWGLRDELKSRYADPDGLEKQRLIVSVMEKIIRQEVPAVVIDNSEADWILDQNRAVRCADGVMLSPSPEPDTRYERLLAIFQSERKLDAFSPAWPTLIDRRFLKDREIPEQRVEALFKTVLSSDAVRRTARIIEKRLGRPLEPFDIWYDGFKPRSTVSEDELNKMVSSRYPNVKAFQDAIPDILVRLGFAKETAGFLGSKITVDPARGSGHAQEAGRRVENARLRTRVTSQGMNYKGYNIALHELGHTVEQVLTFNRIDHTILRGVPNTAFTEAFAFVFQARDLDLLGLTQSNSGDNPLKALDELWSTYEIVGVSLTDMAIWHWMYDHPQATAGELKLAVLDIAKNIWNQYYAPVFGKKDVILFSVYSHIIDAGLYLPDYALGHLIAFQIKEKLQGNSLGAEMERMCRLGSISPDAWMRAATGAVISAEPLIGSAENAIEVLKKERF